LEALQGNLKDIYRELKSRNIPYVRTVADLEAACESKKIGYISMLDGGEHY